MYVFPMQEAFFGKTLLDQSKKALLVPPGQRHPQGLLRPPLPGQGPRPMPLEPGKHSLSGVQNHSHAVWRWSVCDYSNMCVFVGTDAKDRMMGAVPQLKHEGGVGPTSQGAGTGRSNSDATCLLLKDS